MKNLSVILEETVKIDVCVEELFGMSEAVNELDMLGMILKAKDDECGVIAGRLEGISNMIENIMNRAQYQFYNREEES